MNRHTPSPAQWALFDRRHAHSGVTLVYLLRPDLAGNFENHRAALVAQAQAGHGRLRWAGRVDAPLNAVEFPWREVLLFDFPDAASCHRFEASDAHREAVQTLAALEVYVARRSRLAEFVATLMQRVMPWFAPREIFSRRDLAEESVSDIDVDLDRLRQLQRDLRPQPICILNFHRYRKRSVYRETEREHGETRSGFKAYMRYGRAAMRTVLGRGNHLLLLAGYGQCLIGQGGEPAARAFDEVTLMQYHSRAELLAGFSLKTMEDKIRHRRAGLERAVMVICEPDAQCQR